MEQWRSVANWRSAVQQCFGGLRKDALFREDCISEPGIGNHGRTVPEGPDAVLNESALIGTFLLDSSSAVFELWIDYLPGILIRG